MITKQELIDSGFELITDSQTDFAVAFKTKTNKYFWLSFEEGDVSFFQDHYENYYGFTVATAFTDIIALNTFVNLYL
jgi:hypothetical protein